MTLLFLALDRIRARPAPPLLATLAVALSVAIVVVAFGARREVERSLAESAGFGDLIVGPRVGPLELFLAVGPGLVPVEGLIDPDLAYDLRADHRVASAAPVQMVDDVRGWRLIGATAEHPFFAPRDFISAHLLTDKRLAVVGAAAAMALGLEIGDTFVSTHDALAKEKPYEVVEILRASSPAIDRSIFVPLASARHTHAEHAPHDDAAHDHAHHDHAHHHDETDHVHAEGEGERAAISALLVTLKTPLDLLPLHRELAELPDVTVINPRAEAAKIRVFLADVETWLWTAAAAIIALSALSIGAAMAGYAEERRREAAIMRALGASFGAVVAVEAIGALLVSLVGAFCGLAGGALLMLAAGSVWTPHLEELRVILLTVLFGLAASLAVSLQLYRLALDDVLRPRP